MTKWLKGYPTIDIMQESSLARGALESFSNSILLRELIRMLLLYSDFNDYPYKDVTFIF